MKKKLRTCFSVVSLKKRIAVEGLYSTVGLQLGDAVQWSIDAEIFDIKRIYIHILFSGETF